MNHRDYWVNTLLRIANPVFDALAHDQLRERMVVETSGDAAERAKYSHLEAVGRSLAGVGPWLNASGLQPEEEARRSELADMVRTGLGFATDPSARDFLNFSEGNQPLVDTGFLAQGLLRSWDAVWLQLDRSTQDNIVDCMLATRALLPAHNNWLLFSAMIETFLCEAGRDWDRMRVDYALRQHEQWYLGDGMYSDGPAFRSDYYNSFVIQPMLYEIVTVGGEISEVWGAFQDPILDRIQRYSSIQERHIAPDGTFPPIGRSLSYRFGVFHALSLAALKSILPPGLAPAGVRCALTAVVGKMMNRDDVFDDGGWLRIGFCGDQPSLGEYYVSTGSLYACLNGLLPLGLAPTDPFWADPDSDWTSKRIWGGEDIACDRAIGVGKFDSFKVVRSPLA